MKWRLGRAPFLTNSQFGDDKLYMCVLDQHLSGYQAPHQFRIKIFHEGTQDEIALLHYKNWAHSPAWLPRPKSDEQVVLDLPCNNLEKVKERKLSRGLLTTGQRIAKAVEQVSKGVCSGVTHPDVAAHDVPENEQYTSDYEANVFVNDDNPFPDIQGIMWIHDSPSLKQAPLRSFQELEVRNNCQKVQKIFADVMTKFAPKYKNIFDDLALQNWSLWKDRELSRWGEVLQQVIGDCDGARHGNLELPLPYAFEGSVSMFQPNLLK